MRAAFGPDELVGCVVAGGRSSRMGRDKGTIELGGRTLLERAVAVLAGCCGRVCVAGAEVGVPEGVAVVRDQTPGCGPLGGVVAGLAFAEEVGPRWVVLLPVDMPLLPSGLLTALVALWREQTAAGAWVCCAEADGVVQPLVSVVHVEVRPRLERALAAGEYRLRPALVEAARALAREAGGAIEGGFVVTPVWDGEGGLLVSGFAPTAAEWRRRALWFSNCNSPEEMERVREALADDGGDRRVGLGRVGE